jgi:RNA polymerase sigma factor (sigma-70 family)
MVMRLAPQLPLRALSDDRLARLAADGDVDAFAAIYARHCQGLYHYCVSLVGDRDDAGDALQSTLVKALKAIATQSQPGGLRAWLYRIAHNEAMSVIRARQAAATGITEDMLPGSPGADTRAAQREELRNLLGDLGELSARQRGALTMRELNGLEYPEIARALGMSPDAAKQTIYEARRALQDQEAGRATDCDTLRRSLSGGDGRVGRGRKVRAHLRACAGCRDFHGALSTRPAALAALAPALP